MAAKSRVAPWDDTFEELIRTHLTLAPDLVLEPDDQLRSLGLDSMRTVNLLIDLERVYNVTFTDELITLSTFATPGVLWTALGRLRAGAD